VVPLEQPEVWQKAGQAGELARLPPTLSCLAQTGQPGAILLPSFQVGTIKKLLSSYWSLVVSYTKALLLLASVRGRLTFVSLWVLISIGIIVYCKDFMFSAFSSMKKDRYSSNWSIFNYNWFPIFATIRLILIGRKGVVPFPIGSLLYGA
jgi:hypothetical protein